MDNFLLIIISLFSLLTIASYSAVLSKKINFPYTIILFIVGIFLVTLGKIFPILNVITELELSKDLVFYVFLPTLIFESAYNMPYKKILFDSAPIMGLSIFSLLISASIIGLLLKVVLMPFFDIPYLVSFLFGAIISATDPVAVLSIFKEFGVPKRILYLFESESLFNDGTAVALFFIIFEIIQKGIQITSETIGIGILSFLSMIIGGIIFGLIMGVLFSKLIGGVRNSSAELTFTLILAHTTFILSEIISSHFEIFKISSIIATTIAALTLGNYGRYKISKKVRHMMDVTWGYLAFVSNSLIFLLMGMMIGSLDLHIQQMIWPIFLTLLVVVAARIISVIIILTPLNYLIKVPISWNWQKLLAWGSLRGAIAITMLLFIPTDLVVSNWHLAVSVKEFLSILTISCIIFTLIFKTITIKSLIKKMGLANLSKEEEFTFHQIKDVIDNSILKRLDNLNTKKYISKNVITTLIEKYKIDDKKEVDKIKQCKLKKAEFRNLLKKYTLGVERRSILEAFESNQVDERTLKKILNKIEEQYMRMEMGMSQIKEEHEKDKFIYQLKEKIRDFFIIKNKDFTLKKNQFVFYRSRALIAEDVIQQLDSFRKEFYSCHNYDECFQEIIDKYKNWHQSASEKKQAIEKELGSEIENEGIRLLNSHFVYIEQKLIDNLYSKHIMNGKIKKMLKKSIWKDVNLKD